MEREHGLKPVLARQTKYLSPQTNEITTIPSTPPQPGRFVSPAPSPQREPSPIAPLVPPSPLPQENDVDTTLPLAPTSQHLQVEDLSGDNEEVRSRPPSQQANILAAQEVTPHNRLLMIFDLPSAVRGFIVHVC